MIKMIITKIVIVIIIIIITIIIIIIIIMQIDTNYIYAWFVMYVCAF